MVGTDDLRIWPNPATGIIYIKSDNSTGAIVALLSTEGKVLLEKEANPGTTSPDLGNLPKGLYFIRYSAERTIMYKKLIIR